MENHEIKVEEIAEQPWEETVEFLTADMDPHDIDICILTKRYKEYISELQKFNLEVPAQAIRLCTALLKIKTLAVTGEQEKEEEEDNPMDFEDEELFEEEEELQEGNSEPNLEVGPDIEIPVKPKPQRRMSLNELKSALGDAMQVKQRREERREMRNQMDDPVDLDEESLEEKVNSLFSKLTSLVSNTSEKIPFNKLIENNDNEEQIEKFLHILHLENEEKVQCIQEEWLGELEVKPEQETEKAVN